MKKKLFIKIICLLFLLSFSLSLVFFYRSPIKKRDIYFLDSPQKEEEKKDVEPQTDDYDEGVSQGYSTFLISILTLRAFNFATFLISILTGAKNESKPVFITTLLFGLYQTAVGFLSFFFIVFFVHLFSKNKKSFLFHLKNVYFFRSWKRFVIFFVLNLATFVILIYSAKIIPSLRSEEEENNLEIKDNKSSEEENVSKDEIK